ncbi:uncharacterized protein B0H18DRAFT_982493 [Fomitopsis serialis]|uniref:uncharacterized protein n=1 Tax=Fomitopsis serialis TaxID=139415 RepID=UPI00200779CE|nr:uncharacterized protein B0H18DRAFT_982493 [Neoantrodia serialis]KAH9933883.1 hypothetical protein B0H18DRAFT_982493 [Neoantrodia serialis]
MGTTNEEESSISCMIAKGAVPTTTQACSLGSRGHPLESRSHRRNSEQVTIVTVLSTPSKSRISDTP